MLNPKMINVTLSDILNEQVLNFKIFLFNKQNPGYNLQVPDLESI